MGVLIPVGYGLAALHWRANGALKDSVSTFGYNPPVLDPEGNANLLYGAFVDGSGDDFPCNAAAMSSEWAFIGITVTEMDDTGPLLGQFLETVQGTATAAPVPINSAVLIRKNTALGGRKNRGRMYIPPIRPVESGVSALGVMDSDQVGAIQSRWNLAFSFMVDTLEIPMVVLHSGAGTPPPVTSLSVQSLMATQRRRMR